MGIESVFFCGVRAMLGHWFEASVDVLPSDSSNTVIFI